jgi:predicted RNA-binding protein YlqC (UPF0109 family)
VKDLIEFIASSIVDDPTQVSVRQSRRRSGLHFTLQVAKEDMGRVIGKGGKVANSMRTLLKVAAAQQGRRATLDIEEPK